MWRAHCIRYSQVSLSNAPILGTETVCFWIHVVIVGTTQHHFQIRAAKGPTLHFHSVIAHVVEDGEQAGNHAKSLLLYAGVDGGLTSGKCNIKYSSMWVYLGETRITVCRHHCLRVCCCVRVIVSTVHPLYSRAFAIKVHITAYIRCKWHFHDSTVRWVRVPNRMKPNRADAIAAARYQKKKENGK